MVYKIKIDHEALLDLQEIIDWYNLQEEGLGIRFFKQIKSQINSLKKSPLVYANRYADVRCMIIKKFPFMVHYTVNLNQQTVVIFAIFHCSRNPKIWEERKDKN